MPLKYFYFAFFLLASVETEMRFILDKHVVSCYTNNTHVKRLECETFGIGTDHGSVNLRVMTDRNFGNDTDAHIKLSVKPLKGKQSLNLVDLKINVCSITREGFGLRVLNTLLYELRRTSNFPFKCPFKGNYLYKVDNYTLSTNIIPPYTPDINLTYSVTLYQKNQFMAQYVSKATLLLKRN